MTTIATICARGGSKGLPGKNIRPFAGQPLIVHSITFARAHPAISAVYVSTDDPTIAEIAAQAGALVPFLRPAELARDDTPKLPVIEHLVRYLEAQGKEEITRIVDLQPTSPLRAREDLDGCLDLACSSGAELVLSAFDSGFNPYFNLVEQQPDGSVRISKGEGLAARQAAPKVWALNGSIYVWQRAALSHAAANGLWSVRVAAHIMPSSRSVDIDTADDFALAEWLHARQNP